MTKISATIVADSLAPSGDRLTTMLVTFPRFILAELNTHRMLSKNSASSRAIPFKRMVESVQENPFIPIAWQKDHSGMQGTEYVSPEDKYLYHDSVGNEKSIQLEEKCIKDWHTAKYNAIKYAKLLNEDGVTKQLCNRLLEPFMWHTVLISGTEWENFFNLRCPQYVFHDENKEYTFRSKKDVINHFGESECVEYKEGNIAFKDLSDLHWLKLNVGQAEIHMMALAESMWDAYNESTPKELKAGEWHIPYQDKINLLNLSKDLSNNLRIPSDFYETECEYNDDEDSHYKSYLEPNLIKVSTAMCARVLYTVVGDEKEVSYETLLNIHDRMANSNPFHASPFEHCAKVMNEDEYNRFIKGEILNADLLIETQDNNKIGWCRNYKGFIQYREVLENK